MPADLNTLTQPESKAAELIGALLEGGEAVDEGSFTLDPAAAAVKLAQFRYADRTCFLISILEGLFRLGAARVEIGTNRVGRGLWVRATWITLPEPERALASLHAYGLAQPRNRLEQALRRLAIGLDMALAEDLADRAQITCASASFELRPRQPPRPIARAALPADTLELILTSPQPWWKVRRAALDQLRAAVRHARVVVIIDGRRVSGEAREWFTTEAAEGPGFRVSVGLEQREDTDGLLELWTAGICVERRSRGGFASRTVVELDAPRRDLGQMAIVDDPIVEQALAAADWARVSVLERLAARGGSPRGASRRNFRRGLGAETQLYRAYYKFRRHRPRRKGQARRREDFHHGLLEQANASWTAESRPPEWPPVRVDAALAYYKVSGHRDRAPGACSGS